MSKKIVASVVLLFVFIQAGLSADKLRIEPAFWWVDMKNTQLQILIYGKDINLTVPQFNYPGVTLDSIVKTDNKNYLFLYLTLHLNTKPGKFEITFSQKGKASTQYIYEFKERRPGSAERNSYNASDVIYLLMPDRFSNGNPANDNSESSLRSAVKKRMSNIITTPRPVAII
jgi:hypothetical protein